MVVHCTARVWCTIQYSNTCRTFHGTLCAGKRCRTYRRMIACIQTKRSAFCAQSPGRHCICGVRCAPAPPATDVVTARKAHLGRHNTVDLARGRDRRRCLCRRAHCPHPSQQHQPSKPSGHSMSLLAHITCPAFQAGRVLKLERKQPGGVIGRGRQLDGATSSTPQPG